MIRTAERDAYINTLEAADGGDLRLLSEYLAVTATATLFRAAQAAEKALRGDERIHHPNAA